MNYEITSVYDDNLFSLSEEDIKNRYITPSIEAKGWTKNQTRMEYTIREKMIPDLNTLWLSFQYYFFDKGICSLVPSKGN